MSLQDYIFEKPVIETEHLILTPLYNFLKNKITHKALSNV